MPFLISFRNIDEANGTTVSLVVSTEIGGQWNIVKTKDGWILNKNVISSVDSKIIIDPNTAWKLFSKSLTPEQVIDKIEITGNRILGEQALKMVSVMA